ncbi:hypothetical protein B0I35DRAFT_438796 [Stachybotrys elegans]|uniref:Uncharacterized protein n=1 Tax=Stachybotrys elegans TaxID=80388 RepID=A0A8K0SMK1_9HYPO|nr:hypothetical protein B0I35DRAFT_438796 [Stachybotrys elegans]
MAVTRRRGRSAATSRTEPPSNRNPRSIPSRPRRASARRAREEIAKQDLSEEDESSAQDLSDAPSPPPRRPTRHSTRTSPRQKRDQKTAAKATTRETRIPSTHQVQPARRTGARAQGVKRTIATPPTPRSSHVVQENGSAVKDEPEAGAKIPDWTDPRIPYDAWADIFIYAGSQGDGANWLVRAATTCRALLEPALAAMYRCPNIKTAAKGRRLVALLERDPTETCINYRTKIESLHIDIHIVPQSILYQLIAPLPRLQELIIFTPLDHVPYRALDTAVRWHYTADIFRGLTGEASESGVMALSPAPTHLKSFEWSGSLLGGMVATIGDVVALHQTPAFSNLTRVSFTNVQVPSLHKPQPKPGDEEAALMLDREDGAVVQSVANAIAELKSLKHLVFESSTVMNDRLLPLLPDNLEHVELINCWEIKSEDLQLFLSSHGTKIRYLTLMHNQSLDLAFLTTLADTCPCLQELRLSMLYYRHHDSLNDADPLYDFALLPDQVPKWPSSIRVIEMEHIRDWSVETAEMFFQSLIDSAPNLPNLRHLAIKTMLDIPWQTRATMRHEWRGKLERVFLRPLEMPRSGNASGELDQEDAAAHPRKRRRTKLSLSPSRRSGRIAAHKTKSNSKLRRRQENYSMYREPDTDEDITMSDSEDEGHSQDHDEDAATQEPDFHVQGLCTTVSILFDNQKPREIQYGMEDFRVEDEESEEEWDGDYEDDDSVVF